MSAPVPLHRAWPSVAAKRQCPDEPRLQIPTFLSGSERYRAINYLGSVNQRFGAFWAENSVRERYLQGAS